MEKTLTELEKNRSINILVHTNQYDIAQDNRYLVPFIMYEHNEIRFGFADKDENIVIPPKYDKVFDDFYNENDLVRVGKRFVIDYGTERKPRQYKYYYCGLINSSGEELISCNKYWELFYADPDKSLLVAHGNRQKGECALINIHGEEIVPYGRFSEIYHFDWGFARTQNRNGWGVIDIEGNDIIPCGEFDEIWNLDPKYPHIVVQRGGVRYTLPIEVLIKLRQELKSTGSINTLVEQYLDYQDYLQRDFTHGITMSLDWLDEEKK